MNYIASEILKESRKKFGISNVAALVIVVIILAAAGIAVYGVYGGGGNATTTGTGTGSSNTNTSSGTGTGIGTANTTSTKTITQRGLLSVLISDPPHLPEGVSALFITYPSMYVHVAGLPDGEGWTQVSSTGSIQLLGAVNIGQTVATASIPADEYNMIRFNVSFAVVTYNNQNYTAVVQNGNLTVHFIQALMIDPAQPRALIVDISPFVFNFGTSSNPSFVVKPSAISFCAPAGFATPQMQHIGNMFQFQASHTWFWQYRHSYNPDINMTSATLSNTSLSVSITNPSNQGVSINAITITSLQGTPVMHGFMSNITMPGSLSGSAVFLVLSNGTLNQLTRPEYGDGPLDLSSMIWSNEGYSFASSASVSFSYIGTIQLSLRMPMNVQPGEIVSGQQYLISIVGDNACANYVVTAS